MDHGIQNFAGIIIENDRGEILLVRRKNDDAYAIPWCRLSPGKTMDQCLQEKVLDLTGLKVSPVFLGPNEHIVENSHFISFDHIAHVNGQKPDYLKNNLNYRWVEPCKINTVSLVPLTRKLLEEHCRETP